jgi:hypothetical protein
MEEELKALTRMDRINRIENRINRISATRKLLDPVNPEKSC